MTYRIVVTFAVLMFVIRLQGKKQIAQFSYFNYINGIALGSLAANIVINRAFPFVLGVFMMFLWAGITWVVAYLSLKSLTLRRWFEGESHYMIRDGKIIEKNLRREYLTVEDLVSMARQNNSFSLGEVEHAILELNGNLSVKTRSQSQIVTRGDLNLHVKKAGVALPIIIDGEIMEENLRANGLNEDWVRRQLKDYGMQPNEVFYMELQPQGSVHIEKKSSLR